MADQRGESAADASYSAPSKDAVEYGRRHLLAEIERLREGERSFNEKGEPDKAARWRFAAYWLDRMLGHGCVIGAFDERWLDDGFRTVMEEAVPIGLARKAEREAQHG